MPQKDFLEFGDKAIKLVFYQVEPGRERSVYDEIASRTDGICSRVFYSFGPYDIVHLHLADGFDPMMTQKGTLDGVTKVSRFYCYSMNSNSTALSETIATSSVVGVKLLKLKSPNYAKLKLVCDSMKDVVILGTIGWNDLVVLYFNDNANKVLDLLLNDVNVEPPHKKTFSIMGFSKEWLASEHAKEDVHVDFHFDICSYEPVMTPIKVAKRRGGPVNSMLGKYDYRMVFLQNAKVSWGSFINKMMTWREKNSAILVSTNSIIANSSQDVKTPSGPKVVISDDDILSVEMFNALYNVFVVNKLIPTGAVGSALRATVKKLKDTSVGGATSEKEKVLAECLNRMVERIPTEKFLELLNLDTKNKDLRHAFGFSEDRVEWKGSAVNHRANRSILELRFPGVIRRIEFVNYYDYNAYIKCLGDEYVALKLATHVNSFNTLLRNKIVSDCFRDMGRYITYLHRIISDDKRPPEAKLKFALVASENLEAGAELRLNGTLGTIEDTAGHFSKLKGGFQQSLHAMEYVVASIFNRITGFIWDGFINVSRTNLFHINEEIINVPLDAFWSPNNWAPLYHEIGHLVIAAYPALFCESDAAKVVITGNANYPDAMMGHMINQISADIIGYLIGGTEYDVFEGNFLCSYARIFNNFKFGEEPIFTIARPLFVLMFIEILEKRRDCPPESVGKGDPSNNDYDRKLYDSIYGYFTKIRKKYFGADGNPAQIGCDEKYFIPLKKVIDEQFVRQEFLAFKYVDFIKRLLPFFAELVKICALLDLVKPDNSKNRIKLDSIRIGDLYYAAKFPNRTQKTLSADVRKEMEELRQREKFTLATICRLIDAVEKNSEAKAWFTSTCCKPLKTPEYTEVIDYMKKGKVLNDPTTILYPERLLDPFIKARLGGAPGFSASMALITILSFQYKRFLERGGNL